MTPRRPVRMAKALALCARAKRKHERTAYVRLLKVRTGRPSLGGARKLPRYLRTILLLPKKRKKTNPFKYLCLTCQGYRRKKIPGNRGLGRGLIRGLGRIPGRGLIRGLGRILGRGLIRGLGLRIPPICKDNI